MKLRITLDIQSSAHPSICGHNSDSDRNLRKCWTDWCADSFSTNDSTRRHTTDVIQRCNKISHSPIRKIDSPMWCEHLIQILHWNVIVMLRATPLMWRSLPSRTKTKDLFINFKFICLKVFTVGVESFFRPFQPKTGRRGKSQFLKGISTAPLHHHQLPFESKLPFFTCFLSVLRTGKNSRWIDD